jgi:glutamate 5-kinase
MEKAAGDDDLIIVKTGTRGISNEAMNKLDLDVMREIALDMRALNQLDPDDTSVESQNLRTLLVSSAGVTAGVEAMDRDRPEDTDTEGMRLASMIGGKYLYKAWEEAFGLLVAEGLVTGHELDEEEVWNLVVEGVVHSLGNGYMSIFNNNDAVSDDELFGRMKNEKGIERKHFGDNDQLASQLARKLGNFATAYAGIDTTLLLLTDTDGFREKHNDPDTVVSVMYSDDMDRYFEMINDENSNNGGMKSKLEAARSAASAGVRVVISSTRESQPVSRALSGEVGTVVLPSASEIQLVSSTANR